MFILLSLGQKRLLYHTEEPFDFAPSKRAKRDEPQKGNYVIWRREKWLSHKLLVCLARIKGEIHGERFKYAERDRLWLLVLEFWL